MKFFVNEEKRTVVAIVENCTNDFRSRISKNPFFSVIYVADDYKGGEWTFMNDSYKGIAKCSPEDTFDVEIGKTIAMNRALRKYYSDLRNKYSCFMDMLYEVIDIAQDNYGMVNDRLVNLIYDYEDMIFSE